MSDQQKKFLVDGAQDISPSTALIMASKKFRQ
jgi:hypothetical protein